MRIPCNVLLLTDQISLDSVNACISYNGFSEVTAKRKLFTIAMAHTWRPMCTCVQTLNTDEVCVQSSSMCSNTSSKTLDATAWLLHRWTPGGNVPTPRSGAISASW